MKLTDLIERYEEEVYNLKTYFHTQDMGATVRIATEIKTLERVIENLKEIGE